MASLCLWVSDPPAHPKTQESKYIIQWWDSGSLSFSNTHLQRVFCNSWVKRSVCFFLLFPIYVEILPSHAVLLTSLNLFKIAIFNSLSGKSPCHECLFLGLHLVLLFGTVPSVYLCLFFLLDSLLISVPWMKHPLWQSRWSGGHRRWALLVRLPDSWWLSKPCSFFPVAQGCARPVSDSKGRIAVSTWMWAEWKAVIWRVCIQQCSLPPPGWGGGLGRWETGFCAWFPCTGLVYSWGAALHLLATVSLSAAVQTLNLYYSHNI